jgi:exodeoxyribonuclease VII small subunit
MGNGMATKTKKTPRTDQEHLSFEALMERLERIVERLEGGELPLEESIALFEEGMGLSRQGTRLLDDAEQKVSMLVTRDGREEEVPFASGPEAPDLT